MNFNYNKLISATLETIYLTTFSTFFIAIFGLILGILLFVTSKDKILSNKYVYILLSSLVNIIRSIPFIIMIIILLPFTKILMGTILGAKAAFPALIIGISPFYARVVEASFKDVNKGVIEAAKAHGASELKIILKVLIPESLPTLISNLTTLMISVLAYSAMAGVIGAGGLGNLAYIEGFQRNNQVVTLLATLIILVLVFVIQFTGDFIVKKIDHR
ncbi:putative methionine ABC transporter permease [Candidatus Hepatincolaceae symbiont of Richtersius coronifer]